MNFDILVADDSKAALFLFKKIINLSGAPVGSIYTAENGKQAIEVLEENKVDLIMTDIHMPEMDGFQLIEYLKKTDPFKDIPIIVITTEGREKYIDKAKQLGAVNYIKKPFQPEQVKHLILETLGVEEDEANINDTEASDF
jgi:two-component system chemotaxis response regulator CheY